MSNLRRFWQRVYDAWLDPKFDLFIVFIVLAALVGGGLYLWIYPRPMPHLVQDLLRLLPDIWELRSNFFVIVTAVFSAYVVLLGMIFKRLERVGARRLRALGNAPKRTIARRIHLFAHRIGLVLAGILLIITGIPLLLHMSALSTGDFLIAAAKVFALLGVVYGIPRLVGWVIAALFE